MVWITNKEDESLSILPKSSLPKGQAQALKASNRLDYLSSLNIMSMAKPQRLSGIVCTIGPSSKAPEFLLSMIENGMNIARMNFSHGSHEYHQETIKNCRLASDMYQNKHGYDPCLAIALDTKGPEIRTGLLDGDDGRKEIELKQGATIKLTTDGAFKEKCTADILYLDYKNLPNVIKPGNRIFIDDGLISVIVKDIGHDSVIGEIENGGNLGSRKGCNLPGIESDLPAVSEKDRNDLLFGLQMNVDIIFASFIRDAAGVREIRKVLGSKGENIKIISKIENQQGINNIDEIIAESDGIMIARGDMGIEIPAEKIFIAQKQIIAKCNKEGKAVICATQMLESMIKKPRATRAEGCDVANAILDGADCTMLSGETAKGDYPLQCIRTMVNIMKESESCLWNQHLFQDIFNSNIVAGKTLNMTTAIAASAVQAAVNINATAIIALNCNVNNIAIVASQYRPHCPIISVTQDKQMARKLHLYRGCLPLYCESTNESDCVSFALEFGKKNNLFRIGEIVILLCGMQIRDSSNTVCFINVD